MNIIKYFRNAFLNLDWPSKVLINLFLLTLIIGVGESLFAIVSGYYSVNIASNEYTGLPAYNGPCPTIVNQAYNIYKQAGIFSELPLGTKNEEEKAYQKIRSQALYVSELSQFCEDPEAQGRFYISLRQLILLLVFEKFDLGQMFFLM